jgi:uncharacterized protein
MTIAERARKGLPFTDELLIDSHGHIGHYYASFIPYNNLDDIVNNMERIGISRSCVCTLEIGAIGNHMMHNERVASFVARRPDRLSGYVTINGNNKDCIYSDFMLCEKMGLHLGAKFHIYRQEYDIISEYFAPVFERLNSRNAVVLHHSFGDVGKLEFLLKSYPNISFIQGHPVWNYMTLARKYDNFYMDTCASLAYDHIREMTASIGSEKIVYGSDAVVLDTAFGFGPVVFANITDDEKRNILGRNMKRIIDRIKCP